MDAVSLSIAAVALVIGGGAVTVLSALTFPLWIRVQGQPHGRFAGLCGANQPCSSHGGKRPVSRRLSPLRGPLAPSPSVV
jgi:hypothetical protein